MKISPVAGTPTLPNASPTGLSIDKLQRIKRIATGEEPAHEKTVDLEEKEPPTDKTITMQTNRNPEPVTAPQDVTQETPDVTQAEPENVVPDANVQAKPMPEDTQQVSPQIAALAKQKRALQVKEAELTKREEALKTEQGQGRDQLIQRVKAGQALSVLEDLGITYDQLTNELLGKQNAPDLTSFEENILKKVEEKLASKDTQQEETVFAHIEKNIAKLSATDAFPFVKEGQAQDKVLELIKKTWHEDGEVLDEEEALELIEAELKEKAKSYARLLEAKLIKEPVETPPVAAETSQTKPVERTGIKTLTNKDLAKPQSNRRQRALAAFLGQNRG